MVTLDNSLKSLLAALVLMLTPAVIVCGQQADNPLRDLPVEVFQVGGLPINVHEATLTGKGWDYVVRLRVSNQSASELRGIRYALKPVDPVRGVLNGLNPTEVFDLKEHESKTITFNSRLRSGPIRGCHFVLIVEQVIGDDSIWEVIKAKDALDSYLKGDYSVQPNVMRVNNAVDAPPQTRVIY